MTDVQPTAGGTVINTVESLARLQAQAHFLQAELSQPQTAVLVDTDLSLSFDRMALIVEANERLVQVALAAQSAIALANEDLTKLTRMNQRDALTDTPNRALMLDRLQSAIGMAQRRGTYAAVLFLDVDNFKKINDTLGHAVGDAVLQLVARRLESSVRDSDAVGRHGGDEFLVLLPEVSKIADVSVIAEKILCDIAAPAQVMGHALQLSISVGVAIYPDDGVEADSLIGLADSAMYCSKRSGGGQFAFHAPANGL